MCQRIIDWLGIENPVLGRKACLLCSFVPPSCLMVRQASCWAHGYSVRGGGGRHTRVSLRGMRELCWGGCGLGAHHRLSLRHTPLPRCTSCPGSCCKSAVSMASLALWISLKSQDLNAIGISMAVKWNLGTGLMWTVSFGGLG